MPSKAGGVGSIPGRRAKIPHDSRLKNQNIKKKQCCNKFNKDFENSLHQKNLKQGGGGTKTITNQLIPGFHNYLLSFQANTVQTVFPPAAMLSLPINSSVQCNLGLISTFLTEHLQTEPEGVIGKRGFH